MRGTAVTAFKPRHHLVCGADGLTHVAVNSKGKYFEVTCRPHVLYLSATGNLDPLWDQFDEPAWMLPTTDDATVTCVGCATCLP